ncbi:hypothetical protein F4805DRAFT_390854 [Annulohypoxylon moriforme]|nr:hypothetical protein F4805DRAFT_390854 [Annulohypoxylon moriforme]
MRHQIAILAVAGLVPDALGQSSMDMSMDMSMPMSMSGMDMSGMDMSGMTMSTSMTMPSPALTPTPTISIPCLVPGAIVLGKDLPTPSNPALGSFLNKATDLNMGQLATDPCGVATSLVSALPSSLHSDAASYQTQIASFVSANAKNISSLYAECKPLPSSTMISGFGFSPANITDAVNLVTAFADTGCVKVAEATGTGKSGSGSGSASETGSKNAAPTGGVAGAAVAAVGFMGAVAML